MIDSASVILSSSSIIALRTLIALRRSVDSKFSYSYISRRIGIKSRSYLSEVFQGKKKLNDKHVMPIVELLSLPLPEAELLRGKLLLDFADLSAFEAERLRLTVKDSEKKLSSSTVELAGVKDINLVMILAVCLHLFQDGTASRRQILDLFSRDKHLEVERGLVDLIHNKILVKEGDLYRYSPEYEHSMHLYTSTTIKNQVDYLKASLNEALAEVEGFKPDSKDTIFYSGIITADQKQYLDALVHVKQNLRSIQSRIESNPADSLIRFNVQIYPVATKR